jgi:hypothetical protein
LTLKDLLADGRVRPHRTSAKEVADLLRVVDRDLADAEIPQLSTDRRFATEGSGYKMKRPLSGPVSRQPLRAIHLRSTALHIVWRAATEKSREVFKGRCPRTPSSAMTMKGGLNRSTSFLSRRRRRGLPYLTQEGHHDR